ncbi:MAG TPA: serine O-acetyltransferase [Dehalococcoidales bacterium]|jgi:serine O-acetyltransferase|nr:serine O-acetyltransferase [Dehalococcoidales bacterium]
MFKTLREDIRTIFSRDPAARSTLEILCCYPGLHALWGYRVAHFYWTHNMRFCGRLTSQCTRFFTGIEIHPGAKIGKRLFIDHGMGVVVGETAEIGDDVLIYQGVVLGGTSLEKHKRHPTIGNRVVIGAAAIVLGPILIGDDARVGANSVVVNPVPAGKTVVGIPGKIVEDRRETIFNLEHGTLPDPINDALQAIIIHQDKIEERLKKLETTSDK